MLTLFILMCIVIYIQSVAIHWAVNHWVYKDNPNGIKWVNIWNMIVPIVNTLYLIFIVITAVCYCVYLTFTDKETQKQIFNV